MPKIAAPLTAIEVKRLTKPGLKAVGTVPGLMLSISTTNLNKRSWILRTMVGNRRVDMGLGPYPAIALVRTPHGRFSVGVNTLVSFNDMRPPCHENCPQTPASTGLWSKSMTRFQSTVS